MHAGHQVQVELSRCGCVCSKCKLYRFDKEGSSSGEWKERGVGQASLLLLWLPVASGPMQD